MVKGLSSFRRLLPLLMVGALPVSSPADATAQVPDFIKPAPPPGRRTTGPSTDGALTAGQLGMVVSG